MRALATAAVCVAVAGCGSAAVDELPPAAEPARSPAPAKAPAGRVVPLPGGPEGLAFDPASNTLAVGLRTPPSLALVDGSSGRVRMRVPLPDAPRHLTAGDGVFYVPAEHSDRLLAIRARDGRVLWQVDAGRVPHGAAALPGGVVAAAERGSEIVFARAGRVLGRVPVARQPGGVAVTGDGADIAVVSVRARVLELYSGAAPHRRLGSVPAGVGPTHAVAQGNWIWVTDTDGDALLWFRLRPELEPIHRYRLATSPYGIALDPVRRRLWITLTGTNRVVAMDAGPHAEILATFPSVRQPNDLAVDPRTGRVFVGSRTDGAVQMIDLP